MVIIVCLGLFLSGFVLHSPNSGHESYCFPDSDPDVGHLDFLEKASKEGDYLIVGLHTDQVSGLL